MAQPTLAQLQAFVAVAELGTYREAALELRLQRVEHAPERAPGAAAIRRITTAWGFGALPCFW